MEALKENMLHINKLYVLIMQLTVIIHFVCVLIYLNRE